MFLMFAICFYLTSHSLQAAFCMMNKLFNDYINLFVHHQPSHACCMFYDEYINKYFNVTGIVQWCTICQSHSA